MALYGLRDFVHLYLKNGRIIVVNLVFCNISWKFMLIARAARILGDHDGGGTEERAAASILFSFFPFFGRSPKSEFGGAHAADATQGLLPPIFPSLLHHHPLYISQSS